MTKSQFKKRWLSDVNGGGITFDDIAKCAVEWGLTTYPKTMPLAEVVRLVCTAAKVDSEK